MKKILIIEDDPAILKGLEETFRMEGYVTLSSSDGEKGYKKAVNEKYDLLILDVMLPNKNGIDICRDLRAAKNNTPILMLTCKKEEMDKVLGLEMGADDYVTKPFSVRELLARVKALLRRNDTSASTVDKIKFADIEINFKKHESFKNKKKINLNVTELKILQFFLQYEGEVVTREMLLENVWGFDSFPTTRTVDNFVLSIRKQIEDDPSNPKHLITIHKAGYKLVK